MGKQSRRSHPTHINTKIVEALELLHIDLCGPSAIESIGRSKYILVTVDDFSRFTWVFFLKQKSDATPKLKAFIKQREVQLKKTVLVPISNLFEEYIRLFDEPEKAIHSEATAADNKLDNLKKVVDEATKEMENEPPSTKSSTGSPNKDSTFQGESTTTSKTAEVSVEGENSSSPPTSTGSTNRANIDPKQPSDSQIEGEKPTSTKNADSDTDRDFTSPVEGEKEKESDSSTDEGEGDLSDVDMEVEAELNPEYDPSYPPLVKWTKDHPKEQIIGETSESVLT
ncbi:uncharacterized protein LOC128134121 [Lactuca sativa]|uniref:uncharacterized protein LOC128134121 n=1 Tax=Lactuca sativa TaxID=4236 RepID=UPI0022AFD8E8|nr:uncharacterized protein LOC128134121 [Lactuca sativa]